MTNEELPNEKKRLEKFVDYYQELTNVHSSQFEWHLGLHISKRILHIYNTNPEDLSELELLVKILELGSFGSGWMDLGMHANKLLNRLSNRRLLRK